MAFSFTPTYADYLSANPQLQGGSEAGSFSGYNTDQWGSLSPEQQWSALGGSMNLASSDPRYAALAQQLGINNGSRIVLGTDPTNGFKAGSFVDPSAMLHGGGVWATGHENQSPATEFAGGGLGDLGWALAALSVVGGGVLAGADAGAGIAGASPALETGGFGTGVGAAGAGLPGAAASGAGVGAAGVAGDESAGLSMNNPFNSGGFDANGNWTNLQPYDGSTTNLPTVDTSTLPTYSGGNSSLLSQLNTGRQYFNGARSVMNLLNGSQGGGQRSGGMGSTDLSSLISSLFGGSGGGGLGGILGLLAGGHQAFGGGVGTASGAQDVANHASALADPWGASGGRASFMNMLTPAQFMSLTSQDPSAVLKNPAYQFDLQQGTNAINMGDAAQGTLRSGNRGYELQNYGQGLASKYGQQMFTNNMATLNALSGLAGVNAGSPTGSAQALMNGFDNASNIRNAGTNGLFGGGSSNPLFGSSGGGQSPIMSLLSQIFGGGGSSGFDMSTVDFGNLPAFNDTSGFDPSQFMDFGASADAGNSLVDATGAFF